MNLDCVVVIPIYKRTISEISVVSLSRCFTALRKYQIVLITHEALDLSEYYSMAESHNYDNLQIEYFSQRYFRSIAGYNRLLLSRHFYKRFLKYKFLLIYQDDAFVFSGEITPFIELNVDYLGAPWVEEEDGELVISGVGNGGLSLRRVQAFYKVLSSFNYINRKSEIWHLYLKMNYKGRIVHFLDLLYDISLGSFSHSGFSSFTGNEDVYFSNHLGCHLTIAFNMDAVKFAFEKSPSALFQLNNGQLPFGCHAWAKYDRCFWKPFFLQFGYEI